MNAENDMHYRKPLRGLLCVLSILYALLMLWLLFGQRFGHTGYGTYLWQLKSNLNLIPFRTLLEYTEVLNAGINRFLLRHAFVNLAGNVVMFLPLGILLPALWPKLRVWGRFLLCTVGLIIAIELAQLFTLLGSCDIDDLILNVLGTSIGFVLFKLCLMMYRRANAKKR